MPSWIRCASKLLYPVMSLLVKLDKHNIVRNNDKLNKYTSGYFMVTDKIT